MRFQYYFNRNALITSRAVGAHLVAIAEAGWLLRFDAASLKLTGELVGPRRASALGLATKDSVLVGFAGGRVARLDVASLKLKTVGSVPGIPVCIGTLQPEGALVVAYGKPVRVEYDTHGWPHRSVGFVRVRRMDTSSETAVEGASSCFFDSRGRLWLGQDYDYYRTSLHVVDLRSGTVRDVDGGSVRGIVEAPDGRVLAYGGSSHGFSTFTAIDEVGPGGPPTSLYGRTTSAFDRPAAKDPAIGPRSPVSQIAPDPATGLAWVVAGGDVYRSDWHFQHWDLIADLSAEASGKRANLDGTPVAATSIIPMRGRILISTLGDGYSDLDPSSGTSTRHWVPRQIGASAFRIDILPMGVLSHGYAPLLLTKRGWEPAKAILDPPATLGGTVGEDRGWRASTYVPRSDGSLLVVSKWGEILPRGMGFSEEPEGWLVAGVRNSAGFTLLSRQRSSLDAHHGFKSPDGRVWLNAWQGLAELVDREWRQTGREVRWVMKFLGAHAGGWLALAGGNLGWLGYDASGLPEFRPITKAWDALRWDEKHVLVLADPTPCLLDLASRNCKRLALKGLDDIAGQAVRDGRGRVWLGGRGIWILDGLDRARPVSRFLPFMADAEVTDIKADGNRIFLALRDQGLAVLEADSIANLSEQSAPMDRWSKRQPHEARATDHFVTFRFRVPEDDGDHGWIGSSNAAREHARVLRCVAAKVPSAFPSRLVDFRAPDAAPVVRAIVACTKQGPLGKDLEIEVRRGQLADWEPWPLQAPLGAPADAAQSL